MDEATKADLQHMMRLLLPYAEGRREELRNDPRIAYYTSAETAEKIIRTQEIWLRDCTLMNDSREVQHGLALLDKHFADASKCEAFIGAANRAHAGAGDDALRMFDDWKVSRCNETFITSFSLHAPKDAPTTVDEDRFGRLSMWRGYGAPAGVALIYKVPIGVYAEGGLNLFFSPVGYFEELESHVGVIVDTLNAESAFFGGVDRAWFVTGLFMMLVMAAVSLKHPGFFEEREWRMIYLPSTFPSKFVTSHRVIVDGKEETVFKTTMSKLGEGGLPGMDLNTLIDRVIVGPTEKPEEVAAAMRIALADMGVTGDRVRVSDIPFRFRRT